MDNNLVTCPTCGGDGELATSHRFTCYSCEGSGKVDKSREEKLKQDEREMNNAIARSVQVSEYRQMGG